MHRASKKCKVQCNTKKRKCQKNAQITSYFNNSDQQVNKVYRICRYYILKKKNLLMWWYSDSNKWHYLAYIYILRKREKREKLSEGNIAQSHSDSAPDPADSPSTVMRLATSRATMGVAYWELREGASESPHPRRSRATTLQGGCPLTTTTTITILLPQQLLV